MCIVAIAFGTHPRWRLIVAANRDELHQRPSEDLKAWATEPVVIAGRDALAGGTWLGVTEAGRFAAVSNVRRVDPAPPAGLSRGKLVTEYLLQSTLPADGAAQLFNPFNMITVGAGEAEFLSNRPEVRRAKVGAGIHGFSNGGFDDEWPKTRRLKEELRIRLSDETMEPIGLFEALYADATSDAGPSVLEEAIFVRNTVYGTRCSTIVAIDWSGKGQIIERSFDADAQMIGETALTFSWPSTALPRRVQSLA
jgi:uncharacterized protein with NRDE domain